MRSPFCLKKVPFRSPFLGNMGPLWVPFLKTSCPPQFLEHCWCLVLFLYTISAQPIRDELPAKLGSEDIYYCIRKMPKNSELCRSWEPEKPSQYQTTNLCMTVACVSVTPKTCRRGSSSTGKK